MNKTYIQFEVLKEWWFNLEAETQRKLARRTNRKWEDVSWQDIDLMYRAYGGTTTTVRDMRRPQIEQGTYSRLSST